MRSEVLHHKLSLNSKSFDRIIAENQILIARLYRPQVSIMLPGDSITLYRLPERRDHIDVVLVGVSIYTSFRDLLLQIPPEKFGYPKKITVDTASENLLALYGRRNEELFGVAALHLEMIS